MLIGVAIDAMGELDLESSRVAGWYVARGALDGRVWEGQGEACFRMIGNRERGRAPALNGMATFAAPLVGAGKKLSAVRVRFVAVCAGGVGHRCFEIAGCVTCQARYIGVFAEQG
jgi:hypothetical protein